jgi:Protein of unknown function (DUF1360)
VGVETDKRTNGAGAREEAAPTQPADYAAINAVYAVLFAGVVLATRDRGARTDPITSAELIPLGAATFAVSKVIAREKVGVWMREPFVDDPQGAKRPRGRGVQRVVGELVTCTRCVGAWSALGVVGLRLASPQTGRVVTSVLAASAANDWLQAGFRWVCNRSNSAD